MAAGLIRRTAVYRVLARTWECDYIDLITTTLDLSLLDELDPHDLAEEGWLPFRRDGARILVATSERPTAERRALIEERLGCPVDLVVTTDWDILQSLNTAYRETVVEQSTLGLWRRDHLQSARQVLLAGQRALLGLAGAALVAGLVLAPRATVTTISATVSLVFLVAVLFKFVVCMVGARHETRVQVDDADVAALDPRDLPTYTVLVPVYREANVVADLIDNLGALDYPREKLEIFLLMEENDAETIEAARAARPPSTITFLIVPPGHPQTKPKACNVGLIFARGEFLVIYDAEDRPEPDQLKKAVIAFRRGGDRLVCVQAALNYWNATDNCLTRMFTLEYSLLVRLHAPRARPAAPADPARRHVEPLPEPRPAHARWLGPVQRHRGRRPRHPRRRAGPHRRDHQLDHLRGGELGVRQPGCASASRWIKGYMADARWCTCGGPAALLTTAGPRQTAAFALLVGGTPATFLFTPPLYVLFAASLVFPPSTLAGLFPGWVLWVSLVNLLVGNGLMIYVSMMGAFKRRRYRTGAVGAAEPRLLAAALGGRLQGALAARDEAALLGEDRPWPQPRCPPAP